MIICVCVMSLSEIVGLNVSELLVKHKLYEKHIDRYHKLFHNGEFDLVNNPIELIKLNKEYLILEGQHRATIIFLHPSIFGDKLVYQDNPLAEIVEIDEDTKTKFVEMHNAISDEGFRTIPDLLFKNGFYMRDDEEKRLSKILSLL